MPEEKAALKKELAEAMKEIADLRLQLDNVMFLLKREMAAPQTPPPSKSKTQRLKTD
jgi:hypothetical protein